MHAEDAISAERLALALWGEEAPAGAVTTVHVQVSRLRKALGGDGIIETAPGGYRLRLCAGALDRFADLLERGRALPGRAATAPVRAGSSATCPPPPSTPKIDRDRAIATATSLLGRANVRLLSVLGPGGVGKTRLALAVAERVAGHACFIEQHLLDDLLDRHPVGTGLTAPPLTVEP